MIYYDSGEEVTKGDHILWSFKEGIVEFVIEPDTPDAENYNAPEGGAMLLINWEGGQSSCVLEEPEAGKKLSVDVAFVRRCESLG